MRFTRTLCSSVLTLTLTLAAAPALAADDGTGQRQGPGLSRGISAALQRDLGLTAGQVRDQGAQQARAIKLDRKLRDSLGSAFAGSVYDARTGELSVMVSDRGQLDEARAAGADARLVEHSLAELVAIKDRLDGAKGETGARPTDRGAVGKSRPSVAGVTSWYVDTESNSVHVTVEEDQADAAEKALARYDDAVTIEESDLSPTTAYDYMDGGDLLKTYRGHCSAGFNLRNQSTGAGYLLTAGHCVRAGERVSGQGGFLGSGVDFGPVLESWYPTFDDALVRNDYPTKWIQGPWVDANPSNGRHIRVVGFTDGPVGTPVCKSGITTMWTCGQITGKDETVVYDGVDTVRGLTRHDACVEKGDSGGANVSVSHVYSAEGVTSGARMRSDGSRPRCLSAFGQQNVSWYFPIADSLAHYGHPTSYNVSLWR
jgi:streptogrisin C